MGLAISKLFGRRRSYQFFSRHGIPLTVVSEGEEVVWTNFEAADKDKDFKYDVPPRSNGDSESTVGTAITKASASTLERRKRSVANEEALKSGSRPVPPPSSSRRGSAVPAGSEGSALVEITIESDKMSVPAGLTTAGVQKRGSIPDVSAAKVPLETDGKKRNSASNLDVSKVSAADSAPKAVSELKANTQEEISVISLNLLSDWNLTNSVKNPDDGRYKHAVPLATWESRLPRLRQWLEAHIASTDVFALQEVDFVRYQEDIKPMMNALGFEGCHQWDEDFAKKGAPNHPFGVATFYRRSKFKEAFKEARSRSFIVGLALVSKLPVTTPDATEGESTDGKATKKKGNNKKAPVNCDWFIVNVHLEADPKKNEKRLGQLSSALFNLSTHAKINPLTARVVVLGDFNSVREEPPVQWLLNKYKPAAEEEEEKGDAGADNGGDEDKQNEKMVHAFNFADAYEGADEATLNAITYADPFAAARVDHLLFTKDTARTLSVLSIPPLTPAIKQFGIFGEGFPTDHFPVGCVLKAIPVTVPEPEEDREDDPDYCPLTEGQMRVLLFLENGAPKRTNKSGKPSPSELAVMKAHAERVNAFASHLNPKQKAWVNKWRKKYKPPGGGDAGGAKQQDNTPLRDRYKRSKSFAAPHDTFDLALLFAESEPTKEELKSSFAKFAESLNKTHAKSPVPADTTTAVATPEKARRRQTVHESKSTNFLL